MEGICPKCENPLVEVEYFSANKGPTQVTGRKVEWEGIANRKITYSCSTQYSNITPQTTFYCPYCLARKVNRASIIALIVYGIVIITIILGIIFVVTAEKGSILSRAGLLIVAVWFAFSLIATKFKIKLPAPSMVRLPWRKRDTPVTTAQARFNNSLRDKLSSLYVVNTPFSEIPHPDSADIILSRVMVRNLINQN